jgi:hypothetical protein
VHPRHLCLSHRGVVLVDVPTTYRTADNGVCACGGVCLPPHCTAPRRAAETTAAHSCSLDCAGSRGGSGCREEAAGPLRYIPRPSLLCLIQGLDSLSRSVLEYRHSSPRACTSGSALLRSSQRTWSTVAGEGKACAVESSLIGCGRPEHTKRGEFSGPTHTQKGEFRRSRLLAGGVLCVEPALRDARTDTRLAIMCRNDLGRVAPTGLSG